ncbi:unnamed protein product [Ectocarpus fasciculatus]
MDAKAGGVLDGLTSLNALTRESSCAAIASLFEKVDGPEAGGESWAAAQRLIAGGLVKKLLPRMVDRAPGVKLQAIGAMRNISAVRDPRMCEVLVHDDCLTPVLTLLDRMSTAAAAAAAAVAGTAASATPGASTPKTGDGNTQQQQQQQQQPTLVMTPEEEAVVVAQLVATLCNLLAAVDVAVGRFTRQGGLQVVMRLLLAEGCRGSSEVFGGALQALHVATDSNEDLSRQLAAQPGAIDQISALVQGADVAHVKVSASMRVQAAGVLVNVAGLSSGGDAARSAEGQAELTRVVLPLLLKQMAYDPTALQQACAALALEKKPATPGPAAVGSAESSMDVDGEAGAGAAAAAAAGAASAAAPMQMETTMTGAAAGAAKDGGQEPAQGGESENGEAVGNDLEGGEKKEGAAVDQPDRDAQLRWEWKLAVAEPLKLTAEVMANLCALAAVDGEEEEEEEWGSDDEDAMEQAACGGAGRQQQQASEGALTAVLLDAMAEGGALQRTLQALQALLSPTPRDRQRQHPTAATSGGGGAAGGAMPPPPPGATAEEAAAAAAAANADDRLALPAGVAGDLADLRATVALCAANLVQNLPAKALGENPHALWTELCGMCEAATERAPSCVETVTGVMWGLVRRAGPIVAAVVRAAAAAAPEAATRVGGGPKPSADPLPLILRLCDPGVTRAFEARVNAVGMLGALGSAAAAAAAAAAAGEAAVAGSADLGLGRALVQAMEDPHVLVQAEALNAVMDVYGDDGLDAAFRASGAPAALAAGVPAFRRKVKQEGKALGRDAMCHLKETALNAGRFVKYKQASEGASAAGGKKREGR